MTIWQPDLSQQPGPRYRAIANALAADIAAGALLPGSRVPTHRELADALGLTVGTVTRAYAEAARRGLLRGEVGRGTFVAGGGASEPAPFAVGPAPEGVIDLSVNLPARGPWDAALVEAGLEGTREDVLLAYHPAVGRQSDREAGAHWLARSGVSAPAEEIVVTQGAQHGLLLSLAALAGPGQRVLVERLCFPGLLAAAQFLRLELEPIDLDADGLCPDALRAACRRPGAGLLYCTPTAQNPTASVMPERRRHAVVEVLREHGLPFVEDDLCAFAVPGAPTPLCALAPELGHYVTSLSKSVAPGLRLGFVRAPRERVNALASGVLATQMMVTPGTAQLASRWIESGRAAELADQRAADARERQRLARSALPGIAAGAAYHAWLPLPEPWRGEAFAAHALARGLRVGTAERFAVGRQPAPHAVRLSLTGPETHAVLKRGVSGLAALLQEEPAPVHTGV
ncbi:MAG: PLP-dependent aminotransferase family protein [Proteobacteria bacterium]|nr:PLP-dependent aminotransferase family protein [Pseudomonadota bacterium]